jgi:hypothetical protein
MVGALLLFPTLGALHGFAVSPLKVLFDTSASASVVAMTLACYQALAMLWAHVQRDAIVHEPIAAMLASLPLQPSVLLLRDAAILVLSTMVLFVPACIAFAEHGASAGFDPAACWAVGYTALSLTFAQLVSLRRWAAGALGVLVSDLMFGVAQTAAMPVLGSVVACLLLAWLTHRLYFSPGLATAGARRATGTGMRTQRAPRSAPVAIARLNLQSLRDGKDNGIKLTVVASTLLTALGAAVAYARQADALQASVAATASTLSAVVAFLFSMSYGSVLLGRLRYRAVLASLPVSAFQWALVDILSVQAIPASLALLLTALWCWHGDPGALALLPTATVAGLGTINYLIYKRAPRHAIALSLLAMIAGAVIATLAAGRIGAFGDT